MSDIILNVAAAPAAGGCVILSVMNSHPTGEKKPQAKAFAYNKFQKESLNLGKSKFGVLGL
ncbi:MAG: hypothetical protein Q8N70_12300 [Deltaproteobacteria bacterium]|nr:hypothetical protein [Deltaproteobacteria bacterium]